MKNNNFINIGKIGICCIMILFIVSACKKQDIHNQEMYAYTSPGNAGYHFLDGGNIALVRNTVARESYAAFPVLLTRAFDQDVQVTAVIDTGFIKTYDSIYKLSTPSPSFPPGTFELLNGGKITIKAGQTSSQDSIQVKLNSASGLPTGTVQYIIPVLLQTASNGIPVSSSRQVMYVRMNVTTVLAGIRSLAGTETTDIDLAHVDGTNRGPDMIYMRGVTNMGLPKEVSINAKENFSLVSSYNEKNNTTYEPFPQGSYQLLKSTVTVKPGQTLSADSFAVKLTDMQLFDKNKQYLLPVEVAESSQPDVPAADVSRKVVYVRLKILVQNIDPLNTGLTGTTMDRATWSVTASGNYSSYVPSNILDGRNNTAWDSDGRMPAWLVLDMGSTRTVKGFLMVPNYLYRNEDIREMEVLSSNDGNNWISQGKYVGTATSSMSSPTNPDIKTLKFYVPVTARYFRFVITRSTAGSYTGLAELNGIE